MKNTSTLGLLSGCQVVVAVALAALCSYSVIYSRHVERNNALLANFQRNKSSLEALLGLSMEYGQANPATGAALGPLLNRLGMKVTTNSPAKPNR
ncbi:MAG TPA: hypothetical protein VMB21_16445 [Candidatus Limnocylindria bacterium]|nr:hypothetical protein [Candidatus Limnocylindria bacterium]